MATTHQASHGMASDPQDKPADSELVTQLFRLLGFVSDGQPRNLRSVTKGEMGVLGCLIYLEHQGRTVAPGDLAEALNLTTARIANALKNLEHKGYIERQVNPNDRRGIVVSITPEGRHFHDEQYAQGMAMVQGLADYLGPRDAAELVRLLGCVVRYQEEQGLQTPGFLRT